MKHKDCIKYIAPLVISFGLTLLNFSWKKTLNEKRTLNSMSFRYKKYDSSHPNYDLRNIY